MASNGRDSQRDIRKMGMLVKVKTSKKKLFILREESESGPARLEYYDSEKKYHSGGPAKRIIILRNCFSINPKSDSKHKFAVTLYTKDDCFSIALTNESEQQDWLSTMLEVRAASTNEPEENTLTPPLFEHIWPVTVKQKDLGSTRRVVPGQYRLCLTNSNLGLIRMNHFDADHIIPLDCIRRCGHKNCFFFLELGRSANPGPGSLWLEVEDAVIAQNMHGIILSAMKNNTSTTVVNLIRPRTQSNASSDSKRSKEKQRTTIHASGTSAVGRSYSMSVHADQPSPNVSRYTRTPGSVVSANSSPKVYGFMDRLHACTEEQFDNRISFSSADDADSGGASARSLTPDNNRIDEESSDCYLTMGFNDTSPNDSGAAGRSPVTHRQSPAASAYMEMPGRTVSTDARGCEAASGQTRGHDGYPRSARSTGIAVDTLSRSPVVAGDNLSRSPAVDSYMDMSPAGATARCDDWEDLGGKLKRFDARITPAYEEYMAMSTPTDEGYMPMTASRHIGESTGSVSSSAVSSISSVQESTDSRSISSTPHLYDYSNTDGYTPMYPNGTSDQPVTNLGYGRLDPVKSYLSDDFCQKRAYSVGSKTDAIQNKPLTNAYVDMTGGKRKPIKEPEKSISAPHLNDNAGGILNSDLFMELDFDRSDHSDELKAGRAAVLAASSANCQDFRGRTSSGGSRDLRSKASSFLASRDPLNKMSLFSRSKPGVQAMLSANQMLDLRRPRTSTICQESLRPRTSSFGAVDNRPRSASGGNVRFRDVLLRKKGRRLDESTGAESHDYLDMTQKRTSERLARTPELDAGYMPMKPVNAASDYLSMTPVTEGVASEYLSMSPVGVTASDYLAMKPGGQPNTSDSYMSMKPGTTAKQRSTEGLDTALKRTMSAPRSTTVESVTLSSPKLPTGQDNEYANVGFGTEESAYAPMKPRGAVGGTSHVSTVPRDGTSASVPVAENAYALMSPATRASVSTTPATRTGESQGLDSRDSSYATMSPGPRGSETKPSVAASGSAKPSVAASGSAKPSVAASGSAKPSVAASGSAKPSVGATVSDTRRPVETESGSTKPVETQPVVPSTAQIPAPFTFSNPTSFLHYASEQSTSQSNPAPPTSRPTDSRSREQPATAETSQLSYATLDLDSVPPTRPPVTNTSDIRRGQNHVYATIDFSKTEEQG